MEAAPAEDLPVLPTPPLEQVILWRRLASPGAEYCKIRHEGGNWCLDGTVVLALEDMPLRARYRITCDRAWDTRSASIQLAVGSKIEVLELTVDGEQRWRSAGHELVALRGCRDIDLGITPATNTLPIRRLGLVIGQTEHVRAAWVRFPGLEVTPLPQRYTRTAQNTYRYESNNGRFVAEIEVDGHGLVCDYPGGWERCAFA